MILDVTSQMIVVTLVIYVLLLRRYFRYYLVYRPKEEQIISTPARHLRLRLPPPRRRVPRRCTQGEDRSKVTKDAYILRCFRISGIGCDQLQDTQFSPISLLELLVAYGVWG